MRIFLLAANKCLLGFFWGCAFAANRLCIVKADVSDSFSLKGAQSNGKKHIACRNRNRDPLRRCHIRSATAYACQSARRLPWHMQPYRHLLWHVFLLQGIMRQRTSPAGAVKQKVADKRLLIFERRPVACWLLACWGWGVYGRMENASRIPSASGAAQ